MREQDRQRIIRQKLVGMDRPDARRDGGVLPTGFPALDTALGGGLPRGRIVEIFGAESTGKSTLALQIAARVLQSGAAAWIDAEHVFDPPQAVRLGVPIERMPLARPDTAEQALEIARRLVNSSAVDLVVIDSAAALVPELELVMGLGESGLGLQSRVLSSGLRLLAAAATRAGAVVLVLNQARTRPEAAGAGETSAGGPALKLWASVRIALEAARGGHVRFRMVKNKFGAAFQGGELRRSSDGKFAAGL